MSRKLPNKFEIIRQARAREEELLKAIRLKCGDCLGFFLDLYDSCPSKVCPLRLYYPTEGKVRSPSFKDELMRLVKVYDNPPEIISEIKKLEAKFDTEGNLKGAKDS